MQFSHANTLVISFDKETKLLTYEDIYSDGSKDLYTQFHISQLSSLSLEDACQVVGKALLARLPETRRALF